MTKLNISFIIKITILLVISGLCSYISSDNREHWILFETWKNSKQLILPNRNVVIFETNKSEIILHHFFKRRKNVKNISKMKTKAKYKISFQMENKNLQCFVKRNLFVFFILRIKS